MTDSHSTPNAERSIFLRRGAQLTFVKQMNSNDLDIEIHIPIFAASSASLASVLNFPLKEDVAYWYFLEKGKEHNQVRLAFQSTLIREYSLVRPYPPEISNC